MKDWQDLFTDIAGKTIAKEPLQKVDRRLISAEHAFQKFVKVIRPGIRLEVRGTELRQIVFVSMRSQFSRRFNRHQRECLSTGS